MGVRQRRTPINRPGENYFWAGILLCVTVGLVTAGVYESWRAGHWGWCWFFLTGEAISILLYFWIVRSWLIWMTPQRDFDPVPEEIESPQDTWNHPNGGE